MLQQLVNIPLRTNKQMLGHGQNETGIDKIQQQLAVEYNIRAIEDITAYAVQLLFGTGPIVKCCAFGNETTKSEAKCKS